MDRHFIYITYDVPQGSEKSPLVPAALALEIDGQLVRHEAGEFRTVLGKTVTGVRLILALDDEEDLEKRVIEVPSHAQNIQVYLDTLPEKYREVLKSAA